MRWLLRKTGMSAHLARMHRLLTAFQLAGIA
jgi:hypothetical protein